MISPTDAYRLAVEFDPGEDWDRRVLPGPTGVLVFPEVGEKRMAGAAPVHVTNGGVVEQLPSNADHWPEWYWGVCEDGNAWVDV